jgi:hypothetical protein
LVVTLKFQALAAIDADRARPPSQKSLQGCAQEFRVIASIVRRVAAIVPLFVCSVAMASPWTVSSGSLNGDINYYDGHNDTDKFGDPLITDGFTFFPADFTASSTFFLAPGEAHDTASVTLTALNGKQVRTVHADLAGDYSTLGFLASTNYITTLTATNLSTSSTKSVSFSSDSLSGAGIFTKSLDLALPSDWSGDVMLQLYAQVNAQGGFSIPSFDVTNLDLPPFEGGAALMQLKVANLTAGTEAVVPLPAAVATFPLLAGVAGIATRKFRGKKA